MFYLYCFKNTNQADKIEYFYWHTVKAINKIRLDA